MSEPLARIIHSSDWHLCHPPSNPLDYFSKRLLAYGANLLNSKRRFRSDRHESWVQKVQELAPTHVVISGDMTISGVKKEFEEADRWIKKLQGITPHVAILGGNHDVYIERSYDAGLFFHLQQWMPSIAHELFHSKVASITMGNLEFILIDVSRPTPWGNASGAFTPAMQTKLEEILQKPMTALQRVVVCHYPLQSMLRKSQEMEEHQLLLSCLKNRPHLIYLHGHTHQQHVIDERFYGYPVTCDAGCLTDPRKSSFAMIDIFPGSFKIHLFTFDLFHGWQTRQTLIWSAQH